MKAQLTLPTLAALVLFLTGCADDSTSSSAQSGAVSLPDSANSGNPPVTMSGYVDTSATGQIK